VRSIVGIGAALAPFSGARGVLFPAAARVLCRSRFAARWLAGRANTLESVDALLKETGSSIDAEGLELYRRLTGNPYQVGRVLRMLGAWDLQPLQDALPRLRTPLLFLAGERDQAVPVERQREVAALVPEGRLVVIRGAGHLLHEERPQQVRDCIVEEARRVGIPLSDGNSRAALPLLSKVPFAHAVEPSPHGETP
jgi:magnesium chelatase accessory protein